MPTSVVLGTGHCVPERIVTNDDLARLFDTSDAWIRERTGIEQRRWVPDEGGTGGSDLATEAARTALQAAGLGPADVDMIVYATLSPDHFFPGDGCFLQAKLDVPAGVPALDVRNQCSGFLYGLAVTDSFIRSGSYQHVLLVGAEVHSTGLDRSNLGRDVTVLFGDGAAAVVLGANDSGDGRGILATELHADGRHAKVLWTDAPSCVDRGRMTVEQIQARRHFAEMSGRRVFKHAIECMPAALHSVLGKCGLAVADIDLLITHQANLRICEAVQKQLGLRDDQVFNNIMRYGNTTAASIPLALDECVRAGRIRRGSIVAFASFGAGFTWGAAVLRW
ncbi:MAG: ketoacyl-ACP synthase III [Candidatus Schekmanbacteria bacterium]|nr:ketoacyl-ACP synthase III [Candidatus Schekmanbacteria bacterium]